jgi:transposase
VVNQYKVARHFELAIGDNSFAFERKREAIAPETALDGIYIIRTSVDAARMDAPDCVRNYKALANVERAFRSLKTVELKVRPIHHRTADREPAHILLCMLAYFVEWHMREAWRERGILARGFRRLHTASRLLAQVRRVELAGVGLVAPVLPLQGGCR